MNGLDFLLLTLVALAAYSGLRRGAALQLLTYGGLLLGLFLGALLAPSLAALADTPAGQAAIAAATLLTMAGVGDLAGWLVGWNVRKAARATVFRPADAAGGALVSTGAVLLCTWFVALNLVNGPFTPLAREIRDSAIVRLLDDALPQPPSLIGSVRRFLNRFGFPEVFSGLPPAPAGPVRPPTEAQARDAFEAAADSTVRVLATACGTVQEGSGFVVAPDYVVTNAHVVAGDGELVAQTPSGESLDATVVLFDPDLDLAVLRVDGEPGPPLELLQSELDRGERGAVLGYPGGGDLAGARAAVRRELRAEGPDIYGGEGVVRDIYELQAVVHPGSSGGPFVLIDGTVAGVVFAASTTEDGIGYALTSTEIGPDVRSAIGRTQPVSAGRCVR